MSALPSLVDCCSFRKILCLSTWQYAQSAVRHARHRFWQRDPNLNWQSSATCAPFDNLPIYYKKVSNAASELICSRSASLKPRLAPADKPKSCEHRPFSRRPLPSSQGMPLHQMSWISTRTTFTLPCPRRISCSSNSLRVSPPCNSSQRPCSSNGHVWTGRLGRRHCSYWSICYIVLTNLLPLPAPYPSQLGTSSSLGRVDLLCNPLTLCRKRVCLAYEGVDIAK